MITASNIVDFDLETRSQLDVTEVGAWRYAEHPSTDILIIRYRIGDGRYRWHLGDPKPAMLFRAKKYRAYNAFFEYCLMYHVGYKRYGWPEPIIDNYLDPEAQVAAHSYQLSMANAGAALHLDIQKDKQGKRLINMFSKPSKKKGEGKWKEPEDYPIEFKQFDKYCDNDVATQIEMVETVPPLTKRQQATWLFTQKMNIRGVPIDREMCEGALSMVKQYLKYAQIESDEITNNGIPNINSRDQVIRWLDEQGYPIANAQAKTIDQYIADEKTPDNCRRIAQLKRNCGKTSTSKYAKAIATAGRTDRVHGCIVWHGARTGRPAGRLIQVQNLLRNVLPKWVKFDLLCAMIAAEEFDDIQIIYDDLMNVLASATRSMICAPEGKELICGDFAQIEARIVFALAGEKRALKIMENPDKDIYCDLASDIYGFNVVKNIHDDERFVGKQGVLGLGYQMAHQKFHNTLIEKFGVDLPIKFCKRVVDIYREKYRKVRKTWTELNNAALNAVRNPGMKYYACNRQLNYQVKNRWLYLTLPSGRKIAYIEPIVKEVIKWGKPMDSLTYMGYDSFKRKWCRLETFGGKQLENAAQAIVADICDEAMMRLEAAGYPPIFVVHDEVISEIDEGFGSQEEFNAIMGKKVSWMPQLPIEVEGWRGKRYRKG